MSEERRKFELQVMINFLRIRKFLPKKYVSVVDGYDLKNNTVCIFYDQDSRQWETFYYKDKEKIDLKYFNSNASCIPYFYNLLFKYYPETKNIIKEKKHETNRKL